MTTTRSPWGKKMGLPLKAGNGPGDLEARVQVWAMPRVGGAGTVQSGSLPPTPSNSGGFSSPGAVPLLCPNPHSGKSCQCPIVLTFKVLTFLPLVRSLFSDDCHHIRFSSSSRFVGGMNDFLCCSFCTSSG